jgi:DNA polymerase family A
MFLGLDTETYKITHETGPVPPLVCSSYAPKGGEVGIMHANDPQHESTISEVLDNHNPIFANAPFDLFVYGNRWDGVVPKLFEALKRGSIHDVLIREKLCDIANGDFAHLNRDKTEGYNLAAVARRRLGVTLEKDDWRLRYSELLPLPLEAWPRPAIEYAQNDALSNTIIFEKQEETRAQVLREEGLDLFADEARQNRFNLVCQLMHVNGIRVDQKAVAKLDQEIHAKWEAAKLQLQKAGLVRLDGSKDTTAAKEVMLKACMALGIEPKETPKGGISLDSEACERVMDPLLDAYGDYTSLQKLRGTYIGPLLRAGENPIHAWWNCLVENGRISCRDPNLTNLPRMGGVRECYVPDEDESFIFADFDKSEMVAWAEILLSMFGESTLADALNAGVDPHTKLAATFMGISLEEAIARRAAGDPLVIESRQTAKSPNFLLMGGGGFERYVLTSRNQMTREAFAKAFPGNPFEAGKNHKEAWRQTWAPDPQRYFAHIGKLTQATGKCNIVSFKSGRLRANVGYSDAANGYFSQLMADYAKDAAWEVAWRQFMEPQSALFGTKFRVFIHDEIGISAKKDRAQAAARELEEVMISTQRKWCPNVRGGASAKVMERWKKG